ncbi:hypothetical protein HaLaN_25786, partial [Haematococcus lacustris]
PRRDIPQLQSAALDFTVQSSVMVVGLPSMIFNASVFRNTVAQLMKDGKIVFDEDVRKKRSEQA